MTSSHAYAFPDLLVHRDGSVALADTGAAVFGARRIASPIGRSVPHPCAVVVRMSTGSFAAYRHDCLLHCAVSDSSGTRLFGFDVGGAAVDDGPWPEAVMCVDLLAAAAGNKTSTNTPQHHQAFDAALAAHHAQWRATAGAYDARRRNCFDYVVAFLCRIEHGAENEAPTPWTTASVERELLAPRLRGVAAYLGVLRTLQQGASLDAAQDAAVQALLEEGTTTTTTPPPPPIKPPRVYRSYQLARVPGYDASNPLARVHLAHFLDAGTCRRMVALAEAHTAAHGWQTRRHETYNTTDFAVADCAPLHRLLRGLLDRHVLPLIARLYRFGTDPRFALSAAQLSVEDLFFVKYEAKTAAATATTQQDHLKLHRDGSLLSFSILLSDPAADFTGGGTSFPSLGRTVAPRRIGDLTMHSGRMLHGGARVTAGRRYLLVGFLGVDSPLVDGRYLEVYPASSSDTGVLGASSDWDILSRCLTCCQPGLASVQLLGLDDLATDRAMAGAKERWGRRLGLLVEEGKDEVLGGAAGFDPHAFDRATDGTL